MVRRGFTLLELLIAITVLAVITTIAYAAFATVVEGVEAARKDASEMRVRQFLAWNLNRNLSSAYVHPYLLPPYVPYTFEAKSEKGLAIHKDRIEFFSTAPLQGARAMPGDLKQVIIEVIDQDDQDDDFTLDRTERNGGPDGERGPRRFLQVIETPLSSSELTSLSDSAEISDFARNQGVEDGSEGSLVESPSWTVPIHSFDVRFYDGLDWVEDWIFAERLRLPWCVEIRIHFPKSDDDLDYERGQGLSLEDDPDFRLVIPVAEGIGIITTPQEVPGLDPSLLPQEVQPGEREGGRRGGDRQRNDTEPEPDPTMTGAGEAR